MTAPAAAIVIPAYNSAATLSRTLDSVAAAINFHRALQDDAFEIIIVDDASTDATHSIAADWAARRSDTSVIALSDNSGVSRARNRGVAQATAPLIFFLDADDDFLPPHLYCCIESLRGLPDAGFARPHLKFDVEIHETWKTMLRYVLPSNLCVRKVCHEFVGGFIEDANLRVSRIEDVIYARMISRYYGGVLIDLATVHHRSYPGNAFDRQVAKFRLPFDQAPETRTEAELRVQPAIDAMVDARLGELDAAAQRTSPAGPPRLCVGVKPPTWHAREIGEWLENRLKLAANPPNKTP